MDQVKFVKVGVRQILLGLLLNNLTHIFVNISYFFTQKKYLNSFFSPFDVQIMLFSYSHEESSILPSQKNISASYIVYKIVSKTLFERINAVHKGKLYIYCGMLYITK